MKLWEKFLTIIFNPFLNSLSNFGKKYAFENFLQNALTLLNEDIINEIKSYVLAQHSKNGGFIDKAGKPDLYYSIFGYFVSEALILPKIKDGLREYLNNAENFTNDNNVHIFCKAILYSKLLKKDPYNKKLGDEVLEIISNSPGNKTDYNWFLGFLALYYLGKYYSLNRFLKKLKVDLLSEQENTSVTLLAVNIILKKNSGKNIESYAKQLMKYYRASGGFAAFRNAPFEDLLSTAVALYTLRICGADLRLIKPKSLEFITSLYNHGGFCATELDPGTDIEYTFYGLLALASLAYENK